MKSTSIFLVSSFALTFVALGSCGDDTSSNPSPGASTGGGAGATTSGGGAGGGAAGTTSNGGNGGSGQGGSGGAAGSAGSAGSGGGGAGGSSGAGGSQDAGTDSGSGGSKADAAAGDGEAGTSAKASANITPLTGGTITGTATFTQSGANVTITVTLANCPQGVHPMHIHAGTGCADADQGVHWDPPRGENIGSGTGEITCMADGTAMLTYTRLGTDPKPWTIGAPTASDVIGHPIIVHGVGAGNMMRHGCGVIMRQ
jgi:Cu/Zn superoxide dismutase